MKKILFVFVLIMIGYHLGICSVAYAKKLTFGWDANKEEDLAGYRMFQRLADGSYDYNSPIAVISVGTEKHVIPNVGVGDWRWVLRAFDSSGNESSDSNECSYRVVNDPPKSPTKFV